jgi:hypothetical protein
MVPVGLFIALYLWRPFVLGFYSDDWSSLVESAHYGGPFSLGRFEYFGGRLWRPVLIVPLWFFTSLLDGSTVAWHFLMIALVAVSCFMVFRMLLALGAARTPATLASGLWLALPWSLGYTAWPMCFGILLALICFLAGSIALLRMRIWSCCAWYAASMLMYEAFYFQFAAVLVFLLFSPEKRRWVLRRALLPLLLLQGAVVVANRLVASRLSAGAKPFHDDWPLQMLHWLFDLPVTLSHSISGGRAVAIATISLCGLIIVVLALRVRSRRRAIELLAVALAFLLGCVVLSVAGYNLGSTGLGSRTTAAANIWLAAFVALSWRGSVRHRLLRLGAGAVVVAVCAILVVSTFARTTDWHDWWTQEQIVLDAVPIEDLKATSANAVILVVGLPYIGDQPVFGDNWGMSAAVANKYPDSRVGGAYRLFIQGRNASVVTWDGEQWFRYGQPDGWTTELWRWTWPQNSLEKMTPNADSS